MTVLGDQDSSGYKIKVTLDENLSESNPWSVKNIKKSIEKWLYRQKINTIFFVKLRFYKNTTWVKIQLLIGYIPKLCMYVCTRLHLHRSTVSDTINT